MSLCKQNFATETEDALNKQINIELKASHTYLSVASYFARDSVALHGFAKFFKNQSKEEREHAEKFIEYQNMRGGRVALAAIEEPEVEWKSARNALEAALQMEKEVNKQLLALHKFGEDHNDPQFCDFLEGNYLGEQVESLKQIADMLTTLNRLGNDGVGLYLFDKDLQNKY